MPRHRDLVAILAIAVLAGLLYFQRGQVDQLKEAERQAVQSFRAARAQTDDAFRLVGAYRDSLARSGHRVDTVVRVLAGTADTIRLRASVPGDSVVIAKFEMFAWADKIDLAVNEVSKHRAMEQRAWAVVDSVIAAHALERQATDSLLALKDRRITAERKQGRKEGAIVVGGLFLGVKVLQLIFKK